MSPCTTSLGETDDLILGNGRALARENWFSPVEPMGHLADDALVAVL